MKISIVTVSYNSAKTIEDTIKSVLGQSYPDIEYIIVDGASKDNTMEIVNKYKDRIHKIVSEKDKGIYDAMNKGVRLATGDVVGILNSDDMYADMDVIKNVAEEIKNKNVDCVWGDLEYVNQNNTNKVVRYWKSSVYKKGKFKMGWHPAHPTFFVKREVYEKFGFFKEELRIAADYEIMLRFLEKEGISSSYIPKIMVKMRVGGESNRSLANIWKANKQCLQAFRMNNLPVSPLILILKPFPKLFQFIQRA